MAGRVEIDSVRCKGCGLCLPVCPKGCLGISSQANATGHFPAELINEECIGCAQCALICPDAAIKVYRVTKTEAK